MKKLYTLKVNTQPAATRSARRRRRGIGSGLGSALAVISEGVANVDALPSAPETPAPAPPDENARPQAASWRLTTTPTAVKLSQLTAGQGITVRAIRMAPGLHTFTEDVDLRNACCALYVRADGGTWDETSLNPREVLNTEDGEELSTEDSDGLCTEGANIGISDIQDSIEFELRDIATGEVYASASVPVVRDGTSTIVQIGDSHLTPAPDFGAETYDDTKTYSTMGGETVTVQYNGALYSLRPFTTWSPANLRDLSYGNPAAASAAGYKWVKAATNTIEQGIPDVPLHPDSSDQAVESSAGKIVKITSDGEEEAFIVPDGCETLIIDAQGGLVEFAPTGYRRIAIVCLDGSLSAAMVDLPGYGTLAIDPGEFYDIIIIDNMSYINPRE